MNALAKECCLYMIGVLLTAVACSTVPVTGRRQLNLIPASQINSMSFQSYQQFLSEHKVIKDTDDARMVQRTGRNIQSAVERYFAGEGTSSQLKDYAWEFNLVDDDQVNAWCMPGGKVVVYTGILPVTRDETGLAVVMGHEIAHAIAHHGNERMSQGLIAQFGGIALSELLRNEPAAAQNLFMSAYGIGANVGVLLPFSRRHESEADHLGLIFMAKAGYDPHAAADFWVRMSEQKKGSAPPEFLSTHPSDQTRIRDLEALIPEAMKYYEEN